MLKYVLYSVMLILFLSSFINAEGSRREVVGAALEFDALYGSKTCYAQLEIEVIRPEKTRKMVLEFWAKGSYKIFARVISKGEFSGFSTLVVDKNIWTYDPADSDVKKLRSRDMIKSWLGSDMKYLGMVRKFALLKEFHFTGFTPDNPVEGMEYIRCIPKPEYRDLWGNMELCFDREKSLPIWFRIFDREGNPLGAATYSNVKEMDGKSIPTEMELVPRGPEGYSTKVRYLKLKFDPVIPASTFSLKNLRAVN